MTPNCRPILFRPDQVRAILDGRKTQTRRLIKPQPDVDKRKHRWAMSLNDGVLYWGRAPWRETDPYKFYQECSIKCPYGKPGELLWVRETFSPLWRGDTCSISAADFALLKDGTHVYRDGDVIPPAPEYSDGAFDHIKWRPSHAAVGFPPHTAGHRRPRPAASRHHRGGCAGGGSDAVPTRAEPGPGPWRLLVGVQQSWARALGCIRV
jgi:hypothetical protein